MKCSDSTCGAVGQGKFCQECGSKMVEEVKTDTVVICNGKRDNGDPCQAELVKGQKFCPNCGSKVDQALFNIEEDRCSKCSNILITGKSFCTECGHRKTIPDKPGKQVVVEKVREPAEELEAGNEKGSLSPVAAERKSDEDVQGSGNNNVQNGDNGTQSIAGPNEEDRGNLGVDKGNEDKTGSKERKEEAMEQNETEESSSDIEILDGSDTEDELCSEKKESKLQTGNLNIIPSSPNTALSTELENVNLGNKTEGNVVIIDASKSSEKEQSVQSSDAENDSEYESVDSDVTVEMASPTNVTTQSWQDKDHAQKKRNKKQKRNKKKRKKDKMDENTDASSTDASSTAADEGKSSTGSGESANKDGKLAGQESRSISTNIESAENKVFGQALSYGLKQIGDSVEMKTPKGSSLFKLDSGKPGTQETQRSEAGNDNEKTSQRNSSEIVKSKEGVQERESGSGRNDGDEQEDDVEMQEESENDEGTSVDQVLSRRKKRNLRKKTLKEEAEQKNVKDQQNSKNKNKNQTPKTSEIGAGSGKKGSRGGTLKETTVYFHALISEDFKFDPDKDKVIFRMEDKQNSWDDFSNVCTVKNKLNEGMYELEIKIKLPTAQLTGHWKRFQYKYTILKTDKDKEKYVWEHFIRDTLNGTGINRILTIPEKWKKTVSGEWHQYDGVIEKEPSTWREKLSSLVFSWKKELVKHAKKCVQYFSNRIIEAEDTKYSLTYVLDQLEILLSCMKKTYFMDAKCWDGYDKENDFKEEVGGCLFEVLLEKVKDVAGEKWIWDELRERQVTMIIAAIFAAKKLGISMNSHKKKYKVLESLIIHPDPVKKECFELSVIEKYFPDKRKEIKEAFVSMAVEIAGSSRNPSWLFLMPWIHFLSDWSKPFESPSFDVRHDKDDPIWWGLSKTIDTALKYFTSKSDRWDISIETVLGMLEPMFEVDYLLPRTLLAAIELRDLEFVIKTGKIPAEVCIGNLIYWIKKTRQTYYAKTYEKTLVEIMLALREMQSSKQRNEAVNTAQKKMRCFFSQQLVIQCVNTDNVYMVLNSTGVLLQHLSNLETINDKKTDNERKYSTSVLVYCLPEIVKWMDQNMWYWYQYMENILWTWNQLYAPDELESDTVKEKWNTGITKALTERLQNNVCTDKSKMTTFVQIYCKKVDSYHLSLQDCMSKTAFKAIENGYALDYRKFNDYEIRKFGDLLSGLFLKEWDKSKKTRDAEKDSLNHFLKWPPFMQFVKIYAEDQAKMKLLSDECVERLVQAVSVIQSCVGSLLTGEITIGNLLLVKSKEINFPELAELVKLEKEHTKNFITKTIQIRQMEMDAFHKQSELMITLTSLCQHLGNADTRAVDHTLEKRKHIEVHKVNEFCLPANVGKVADIETFQPKLCAFKVSQNVLNLLPSLQACSESDTFIKFWTAECQSGKNLSPNIDDVVPQVWTAAKNRWDTKAKQIKTGEIKFQDFEKILGNRYKEDYARMAIEMRTLHLSDKEVKKRIDQLQKYRQLEACTKGAKTILTFARDFNLNGDFEQIKIIATHGESDLEMKSFDDSVMNACDFLKDLTPRREKCLQMFVKCRPLVQWLKESMKKAGLKELKVFVDLAFMSAGDEPINIARVQCLHSAVTGYAPLIFDLKENCDYKALLNLCSVVWKELEANPKLPDKLQDTNRQLQWLKEIKKAHGSVEVTSLMQAEAINANGIFTVGKNAWKKDADGHKTNENLLAVIDIIKLTVPEKEGKSQLRNYTFSQCQDLQSRLMLVAGKAEMGTDSVDRFTMIFDSITRLSNVYIKLCSSGCVLFKDWTARFLCYPHCDRPVCAVLEFGQGDGVPQLKGRRSPTEDLKDIIPELAKFMEACLEEWLHYIKEKRKNYLHLNYYTVDQLVILQRELVKVGTESEPSHLVYPLLSAVKPDCTPVDLIEAMAAAKEEIDGNVDMEAEGEGNDDVDEGEVMANATDDEKKQNFVKELVQGGYDEGLANRALQFVDPEDITAGIMWCMDHDEDSDMSEDVEQPSADNQPMRDQLTERPTFTGWSQSQTDIQTMITANISGLRKQNDVGSAPLISDLTALWRQFLESISSNIRDYLSLEHLGLILKYLAVKDTSEISRSLPPGFKEGQPNLIICPSGDVLMTTLSIYMMDRDQPLPLSDEILMCTSNTTKDEVDIFWRRAIFDGGRKIHCLMNADMLDYDVSEAAERCLEEYLQEVHYNDLKYRLLVICGSDNEYRSTIVSSLDKFKRQPLPANTSHLRDYLANKLIIHEHAIAGVRPAACVDTQRSTVRVIKSWRAGVGKTLFKHRREEELSGLNRRTVKSDTVSIPLQEKTIDLHYVIERLLEHTTQPEEITSRLFHIDVSHEVENGVDYLLFNLLILGCLVDKTGFVWRKSPTDIYLIETMPLMMQASNRRGADLLYVHPMLSVLPDLTCRSPQESLQIYLGGVRPHDLKESDQLFDEKQFRSSVFQRTFQYLLRLDQGRQLGDVQPFNPEGQPQMCLQVLLRHCGLEDPSWSELHHFVWFLNTQLVDFENNMFVSAAAAEDLPGFSKFVLRFLIQMSRDFSTRSLKMSEESPGVRPKTQYREERMDDGEGAGNDDNGDDLEAYQMRRTWESSPHPYLFFNSDRFSFTFLGFYIDRASGNLIDQQTGTVLENGIMAQNLYDSLVRNHAPMQENFDALPRAQKIMKLCNVMGIDMPHDPDDTYELTTDNVKKIMAIYMRFRCDIPVIIMGETGCGKTRLVKFMCSLQQPPGVDMTNMILMKVHGGTTNKDIIKKVRDAEQIAKKNKETYGDHMYTVLFFDEANTTEAIGLIKEIMCDKSMEGKKLKLCENLKMVAACNPYRTHSEELIKKLEQAGLGYHVDADETTDRLGRVPMRRLVYRVQPLPQSLLPLVWDFGQLNTQVEDLYIRQMVRRYIREDRLPDIGGLIEVVSAILTASQDYMRAQKDECSFVSLRDVDRVLTVMSWFYQQSQGDRTLYQLMDNKLYGDDDYTSDEEDDEEEEEEQMMRDDGGVNRVDDITRSLILALGVCYHACLKTRPQYRAHIAPIFRAPCHLPGGQDQIDEEIKWCQEVFLDYVNLEKNIARNMALRENVFMMVVCIELRIPLFLVGKPGSSKSLAKTIVSDAMQGNAAREELFRELKQAQMVSFQCSPLATPDGIVGTFRQCAQFQKDKDLDTFVSIVVLDEVGLAEDSPRMPLKTLHPLLEDGCQGDEKPEKYKKVAFIGISNWALDPAKMNRGILVQREVPDQEELINSATGICRTKDKIGDLINLYIEPMAISYLQIFQEASQSMREFYGLRDFYSLVKMVYGFVEKSKKKPTWHEMLHAIKRNFGGLDQVDPVESFKKNLTSLVTFDQKAKPSDPDCTPAGLVQACLFDTNKMKSESRYLLLLTENYGTLTIIQQQILSRRGDIRPITIFGSSFRSDQEYTQVCRNINKIKVCMETGNTVVLLNLENLYESLYDALNQYYVYFGGERYVDLGLGTHRVKCPVHKNFRLIVVAEKQTVYKKFPIPLINRLEKHFLTINTMLSPEQQQVVEKLEDWAKQFVKQRNVGFTQRGKAGATKVGDVFIGYHDDTCSAIVLDVWNQHTEIENDKDKETQVLQESKAVLLWCATPESLIRLEHSSLSNREKKLLKGLYFMKQSHNNLLQYLNVKIVQKQFRQLFAQITTHSKLMAGVHKREISNATGIEVDKILLLETLSSFDTEQQFSNRILQHIQSTGKDPSLMVIQCDSGDVNANLIACARYCVMDEFEKMREELRAPIHVVFIVQLPRGASFTGFQCGLWHSAHIDDLYPEDNNMPTLQDMQGKSISKLFTDYVKEPSDMEVDEDVPKEIGGQEEAMDWNETEGRQVPPGHPMGEDNMNANDLDFENGMGNEPLQLDDVLLDLKNVDKHGAEGFNKGYGQHRLNVKGLILSCVQAALSMVKDKVENTNKETDRVGLVLTLLHQEQVEGQASFLHGVCCLIAKLLKEKESKTNVAHMAQHWLINEAASSENINKAGTFRRSCIQTLETKVAPILAGIIAYLDTNDNLNILQEEHFKWKPELWLSFLNTAEAINLQYTDLQSPKRQSDLLEVVVMTTGCEGQMFSARMPFSWMLINKINEILKLPHPVATSHDHEETDEVNTKIESSVKVLNEHALGQILSCISDEHDVTNAVQEYIYDFVQTMYKAASVHEQQLVCQTVFYVTTQMINDTTNNSLLHSMVNVHIAYQKLAPRLTYFRAMNSVWPECSSTIVDLKVQKPDHFMFKEQEFTFSALCLLLENLTPKSNDLNNLRGRSHWLSKVHRYRPVVEKVISLHNEDPTLYGAHSIQSVRRAKGLWSRVMVVKLFLEHVCASVNEDKITIKHCMPLWALLGEETDLKEMRSLAGVEKFLKSCNKQAMKEYVGDEVKCCRCECVLEGPPITLPCKDVYCDPCYDELTAIGDTECSKCHQKLPDEWQPKRQILKKNAIEKLKDYQKRCNTFFMDVVSQLCFADNVAPSQEVVEKLLSYIFYTSRGGDRQRTRDLSIFNTGIDPTPVFRSFLLQLLMRTSEENVIENLSHYLTQAEALITRNAHDQEQQYVELCLLVIQCLEDMFTQEASRADVDEIRYACEALQRANQNIGMDELNVEKLYGLASARMGLSITARCVADIVMTDTDPRHMDRKVRKLIEAAQILYEETKNNWTRIYLVKHLCRSYGIDVYQTVCHNPAPFLRWISMKDSNRDQVVEVSDRYIVCGDHYTTIREAITKVILGENIQHLYETVQELVTAGVKVEPMLQLAVHREITSSYLYPQQQRKLTAPVMEVLNGFVQECNAVKKKPVMQMLMTNKLLPRRLMTVEGGDLRTQGIQCLIVHYLSVMMYVKGDRTLLQPLQTLMINPQTCVNMFLPTMPQDDLEDIKEALLAARQNNGGENPVFYRCPNGHPYVIGNCGRPATVGNCRDCGAAIGGEGYQLRPGNILDQGPYVVSKCKCGADIGGQGHKLLATNTQDTGGDTTLTGHILGRAQVRGQGPKPERAMTPAYTATVRLIVHMSMLIGVGSNQQGVQAMIKPDIDINEVEEFIWAHIQQDIDEIHRTLGRSVDDVLLLMHTIIDHVMKIHNEGDNVINEVSQLSSKRGRAQWETGFSAKFLKTSLQNIENSLKTNNQLLVQDHRLGADPLLCLLYETDTNVERENPAILQDIPRVWRYRTPISLQHLRQEVDAKVSHIQHKVLQLFLKEDHHLRALRYIPSILRLHRALFQKYQRKLDKAEASQITVAQLKRDEIAGGDTFDLLQDFTDAWELVRESLPLYLCPTELGGMIVSKEYCSKPITDNTPISILLPTIKEAGLCSYVLLDFLMRKQNDFLDKYLKEAHRKSGSISSVNPKEVTSAHLISYDPQHDILPLVLANCQYSFEMGKGTKIEYDFAALERQLMDRFLFSKSKIDVGRVLMIEQMVYRTEFTDAEVFRKLCEKIPQENLSAAVKTQICGEIRTLPDICTSLDNLDITISFLKSTGGQPDKTLHEFMKDTLQMKTTVHSQKAQQACELKHAQSLWLLLSMQKSKKMVDHNQHTESTFESVLQAFHEELPEDILTEYKGYMKKLSIDKLSQLVEILHEYILLVVAVRQNPDDDDYTDTTNHKLGEWLYGYVDSMDNPLLDIAILTDFPKEILYKYSVLTWVCTYGMLRDKHTGNYRRY